ncbi:hypothetical protein GA0070624_0942 [Micromonospora rhizosphaerae]|uniref:Uncharacterized protein n=2 Tax=Micromonospora rhizosphaerae TaxID=568872 RepID=A0A1C6RGF7_9ACTN|nr:hypothetical protein GA0070624_0942 [Micromonospora rhizosphaerae]
MVNLPAARRHHRSRIGYAFGLLALVGAATTLVVVVRYPALSSTEQLSEPVPAPEITVVGEGSFPPTEPEEPGWAGPGADSIGRDAGAAPVGGEAGGGGGLAEAPAGSNGVRTTDDVSRSLFYSGLLGLTISLAGLGLVGTRRRMW